MSSSNFNILVVIAVTVIGWYVIRSALFKPLDTYYNHGFFKPNKHFSEVKMVSLEEAKQILDKAYISASKILANSESAKSILELEKGVKYLKEAIKERNILAGEAPDRLPSVVSIPRPTKFVDPEEVCPEKHEGSKWDYPFYLKNIPLDPNCNAPPLKDIVTLVFNFVNEIPINKATTLFEDAAACMYKNLNFVAIVNSGEKEISKLEDIAKSKLSNMNIVEYKNAEGTHGAVLHEALSKVKTKYVVLTRNTERFDNFSTIVRLVRDISLSKASVIGGAHRNTSGHWKAGCYQMKRLRGELSFDEGYDLSDNGCMFCDYISGPFGVKKDFFIEYLSTNKQSILKGDFFYMKFFHHVRLTLHKRIHMCIDSMFYTESSGLLTLDRTKWQSFQREMGISKITLPDHKTSYEFTCYEVNIKCIPHEDQDLPFCCFMRAEQIFSQLTKFLKEKKVDYRFHIPGISAPFEKLYNDNVKKNTVLIGVTDTESLAELKIDGFSWSLLGRELVSSEWRLVFMKEDYKILENKFNVKFNNLILPIIGNPGKGLLAYGKDSCTKEKICFDILHFYGTLDSQKVWM